MLFSSYLFLFVFFPIVLAGYALLTKWSAGRMAIGWLVLSSAVFYGWSSPPHLILLAASIFINYLIGLALEGKPDRAVAARRWMVTGGIVFNLALIAVFKYTPLVFDTIRLVQPTLATIEILLPIGISFFTFQQIAYLVDVYRSREACHDLLHYCFFVSFFPQLIAGPIVHHRHLLPQLARTRRRSLNARSLSIGGTIFVVGLFKKVVLADQFAGYATPVFDLAEREASLTTLQAWAGAIAYSFQLYFDFSGYSDMAIGLARLFGLRLPLNFWSPYQATSVIEFWRRWHITLSQFLRDYLYFALGGNRKGPSRRYLNLLITMLLGGLWHGAAWTFVAWGGFHGLLLCGNHGWRWLCQKLSVRNANSVQESARPSEELACQRKLDRQGLVGRLVAVGVTFTLVTLGWVLFRAESFAGAVRVYQGMVGWEGVSFAYPGVSRRGLIGWLVLGSVIVFGLPNTYQWMRRAGYGARWNKRVVRRGEQSQKLINLAFQNSETILEQNKNVAAELLPETAAEKVAGNPAAGSRPEGSVVTGSVVTGSELGHRRQFLVVSWAPTLAWAAFVVAMAIASLVLLDRPSEFIYYQF